MNLILRKQHVNDIDTACDIETGVAMADATMGTPAASSDTELLRV